LEPNTNDVHPHFVELSFHRYLMTWLTAKEYRCHEWSLICFVCRNHNPVFFSFMTCHHVCNKSNTTGATCGTGTAYPSAAPKFAPHLFTCLSGVHVVNLYVFTFLVPYCDDQW